MFLVLSVLGALEYLLRCLHVETRGLLFLEDMVGSLLAVTRVCLTSRQMVTRLCSSRFLFLARG
ncbi:hypothetical protein AMS69_17760 [Haloarcula rubripromontorii]|uniref:Uncharacterized protein n=1 Tax=Haloarcula rubripromontorii TaxID=1705562 RepID=A0A0M9AGL9_9EURY|nr:hypothetical protein AMS69_17760 [Haloarcula rubripromontorii]